MCPSHYTPPPDGQPDAHGSWPRATLEETLSSSDPSPWPVRPGQSRLQDHLSLSPFTCMVSLGLQLCEGAALIIRGQTCWEGTAQPGWQPQACSVLRPGHPRHAPVARGQSSAMGACARGCGSENSQPSVGGQLLPGMAMTLSFLGYMSGSGCPGGPGLCPLRWPGLRQPCHAHRPLVPRPRAAPTSVQGPQTLWGCHSFHSRLMRLSLSLL